MKKLMSLLSVLAPLFCLAQSQDQQHYIFSTNRGDKDYLELTAGTEIFGSESELTPRGVNYKQLLPSEDGGIKFIVSGCQNTDIFKVGFKTITGTTLFSYNFSAGQVGNSVNSWSNSNQNSNFQILKAGNNVTFYVNCIQIANVISTEPLQVFFSSDYNSTSPIKADIDLTFKKGVYDPCGEDIAANGEEFYYNLKRDLDGGFIKLKDNKIRFKFKQDYSETASDVKLKIFDGSKIDKNEIITISPFKVGTNWKTIDISSLSNKNDIYTLELTANKSEKYYLRFQPKDGIAPQPFVVKPPTIISTPPDVTVNCIKDIDNIVDSPVVNDGYTGSQIVFTKLRDERSNKNNCNNCDDRILRIWEGQDSRCYPIKIVQNITVTPSNIVLPKLCNKYISCGDPIVFDSDPNLPGCNSELSKEDSDYYDSEYSDPCNSDIIKGCVRIVARTWKGTNSCGGVVSVIQQIVITDKQCPTIESQTIPGDLTIKDPALECSNLSLGFINNILNYFYTVNGKPDLKKIKLECIDDGNNTSNTGSNNNLPPPSASASAQRKEVVLNQCGQRFISEDHPWVQNVVNCLKRQKEPVAKDNCSLNLKVTTQYFVDIPCNNQCYQDGYYLYKTWRFTDDCGNYSQYTQQIRVGNPTYNPNIETNRISSSCSGTPLPNPNPASSSQN
jgi:hypothetical protein